MFSQYIDLVFNNFLSDIYSKVEVLGPKVISSISILVIWWVISYIIYKMIIYIFKKFRILHLIDKTWNNIEQRTTNIVDADDSKWAKNELKKSKKIKKVAYDHIAAKAISYYVFLLFFRWSVIALGITEVERFLWDIIWYLPNLFIAILIWFFGLRFANSIHDILYKTLEITKQKTSSIIAMWAKIIILFFTLMIMLNYIQIVDEFIINSLLIWFIATMTIAFGLAFGIWGKDVAKEILESFRK